MNIVELHEQLRRTNSSNTGEANAAEKMITDYFRKVQSDIDTFEFKNILIRKRNERIAQLELDLAIMEKRLDNALNEQMVKATVGHHHYYPPAPGIDNTLSDLH